MDDIDSKKRERGPNFPFIGLAAAIQRARQFYDKEKRGSAAVSVIATHWEYSPKSSGLIQTIAALKSYGLMDDEGRGNARRLRLTDRALRILLDPRADSPERQEAIKQAVLSPTLSATIFEKFPNDFPSDTNLEHFLLFDLKFSPESAKAVVKIIKENNAFTDSVISGMISGSNELSGDIVAVPATNSMLIASQPLHAQQPAAQAAPMERIIGPDGEIVLQWLGSPTWESYDFLENYIKLRKTVLKPRGAGGKPQVQND